MTLMLAAAALPVAMMLESDSAKTYFYTERGPDYFASLQLDQEEKEAKSVADHIVAQSKCPYYKIGQLTWQTNENTWPRYFQQVTASVKPGSENWLQQKKFMESRLSWLSDREVSAFEYGQNGGMFGSGQLSQSLSGGTALTQLENFCSHMAKSPANILIEIRE